MQSKTGRGLTHHLGKLQQPGQAYFFLDDQLGKQSPKVGCLELQPAWNGELFDQAAMKMNFGY